MKKINLFLRFLAGIVFVICCACVGAFAKKENIAIEMMFSFLGIISFIIFYTKKENDPES